MNRTKTLRKKDLSAIWHPYTKMSAIQSEAFPVINRAKGIYLYDTDGRKWIDAVSSWWCVNLGHGNKRIINAVKRQTAKLQQSILGNMSHTGAIELANMITGLFPNRKRKVLFCSDGSSAVEAALKMAVQYWNNKGQHRKNSFISFNEAYHGDTVGAISVGFLPVFHRHYKSLCFKAHRVESPCCSMCRYGKSESTCRVECFTGMKKALQQFSGTTAAVIIEPLCQAAGGMRIYSPKYLKLLAAECRKHKVLLIADEIATGMYRTGRMFAFDHAGIDPDITCIGKGLSGGYLPISAVVAKDFIQAGFLDKPVDRTFYHGHTFGGNPIACAAAVEALKIYSMKNFAEEVRRKSALMRNMLCDLLGKPAVSDVRTLGMIGAVEFKGKSGQVAAARIRHLMLRHGILLRPLGNVAYIFPPMTISHFELRQLCTKFAEAVVKTGDKYGRE